MKLLVLSLIAISSVNAFAVDTAVKCAAEYREVLAAQREHIRATDKLSADALDTANYILAEATNLIAQPNARVGGYGYNVRKNGEVARSNVNIFTDRMKAKEELVHQAMLGLEDCLYGIETESTSTTAE